MPDIPELPKDEKKQLALKDVLRPAFADLLKRDDISREEKQEIEKSLQALDTLEAQERETAEKRIEVRETWEQVSPLMLEALQKMQERNSPQYAKYAQQYQDMFSRYRSTQQDEYIENIEVEVIELQAEALQHIRDTYPDVDTTDISISDLKENSYQQYIEQYHLQTCKQEESQENEQETTSEYTLASQTNENTPPVVIAQVRHISLPDPQNQPDIDV